LNSKSNETQEEKIRNLQNEVASLKSQLSDVLKVVEDLKFRIPFDICITCKKGRRQVNQHTNKTKTQD